MLANHETLAPPPPLAFIAGKETNRSSVLPLLSVAVKVTDVENSVDEVGVPETTPAVKDIPAGKNASSL